MAPNTNTNTTTTPPTLTPDHHAALLCAPGVGHIIPFLEFAKRLVAHQIIPKVTFFLPSVKKNDNSASQAETQVLKSAKELNLFDIIILPPIDVIATVSPDASPGHKLNCIMSQTVPLLSHAISTMAPPPTILITDLYGCPALPIADKLKMNKYVLMQSAWLLALSLHTPTLDKDVEGEYLDQTKPIAIPGLTNPIDPTDLFTPFLDRTDPLYPEYVHNCELLRTVDGVLVRTFHGLEPKTVEALKSGGISNVPVYPIGPIIRETNQNRSYVFDWLDGQEEESVVYVSFGSGYAMSYEQIREMALGLDLSGKRFVWSVKPPASRAGYHNYITSGDDSTGTNDISKSQPSSVFPDEFYKIENKGLMVMNWAPQLEILRHPSIGGFVSHCGWNSMMESVSCGVPIVGWPLFGDQRMNAAMFTEEAGIGVRMNVSMSTNMVESGEIARAIRKVMDKEDIDGSAMRKKVKQLKHIAANAWSNDGLAILELASAFGKTNHSNGV